MYNPPGSNRYKSKSQSTRVSLHERVADLQRNLTTRARLEPNSFWLKHYDISTSQPKEVISLGKEGPISIHWKNGDTNKVLIQNLDQLDDRRVGTVKFTETVLAHIKSFQQAGLSFPMEIYLDVREKRPKTGNLEDFEDKLVEGINELNDTNYRIKPKEMDEGYIKLNLETRQVE